jgi:hypothetical protein
MYARLLAFVCLLSCSVPIGRAEPLSVREATVGVYLQVDANASSLSLQAMRLELRDLMVPTGLNLVWTNARGNSRIDKLIAVELRGTCQAGTEKKSGFKDRSPLASTAVTDGKVLPFSWVDCKALDQFMQPELNKLSADERDEAYGRAMARLLAHEFYHVLAETQKHTKHGISKTSFSVSDLMAPSLPFMPESLAQLRIEVPAPVILADVYPQEPTALELLEGIAESAFTR